MDWESSEGMGKNAQAKARGGCGARPCHRVVRAERRDVGRGAGASQEGGVRKVTEIDWWGGEVEFDRAEAVGVTERGKSAGRGGAVGLDDEVEPAGRRDEFGGAM